MDKTSAIVEFRRLIENLPSSKKNSEVAKNLVKMANESKDIIGLSDPDFLRILTALQESIKFFANENKIRESGILCDAYVDLLEELNNPEEMIKGTKELSEIFFTKTDTAYHIYFEDIVNRIVSFLDDDSLLEELADLLITIGQKLQKQKIHEMAITYYERGITYLIDAGNEQSVLKQINQLIETARVLSLKNNEYSSQYIDLVNNLIQESNIDLSKDTNTQLAYQSFSEHLLKSSKNVVASRFTQSGRLHKKKREFFKKKLLEED